MGGVKGFTGSPFDRSEIDFQRLSTLLQIREGTPTGQRFHLGNDLGNELLDAGFECRYMPAPYRDGLLGDYIITNQNKADLSRVLHNDVRRIKYFVGGIIACSELRLPLSEGNRRDRLASIGLGVVKSMLEPQITRSFYE